MPDILCFYSCLYLPPPLLDAYKIYTGSSVQFEFAPTGDDVAISVLIAIFIFFGCIPRCCLPLG